MPDVLSLFGLRCRMALMRLHRRVLRSLGLREPKLTEHQRSNIRWMLHDVGADADTIELVDAKIEERDAR